MVSYCLEKEKRSRTVCNGLHPGEMTTGKCCAAMPYRIPDDRKMYPGAGWEVISLLKTTEGKMQYVHISMVQEKGLG